MPPYVKKAASQPPEGKIRLSQMVTTFGPGAMVDLVDHAVLVGGLDFWDYNRQESSMSLAEPRLRELLVEKLKKLDRPTLSMETPFLLPPVGDDASPNRNLGVKVLEFPEWFVCQNPKCRALVRARSLERKKSRYIHKCLGRKKPEVCVSVRFVAVCRAGHVADFPWIAYAHNELPICQVPSLSLVEGPTGDFSEIVVKCSCTAERPLNEAKQKPFSMRCWGHRPWLGPDADEECDETLRLLVRTATNSYYAQVQRILSIEEPGRELEKKIRGDWRLMKDVNAANIAAFRTVEVFRVAVGEASDEQVLETIGAIKRNETPAMPPPRTAEYLKFVAQPFEKPGERAPTEAVFFARRYDPPEGLSERRGTREESPAKISRLVLAHKLREVRTQVGFTRLEAIGPDLQGEFDLRVGSAPLTLRKDWLPASEIRGEGIFLQIDEDAVRNWEDSEAVKQRAGELLAGYEAWARSLSHPPPPFPTVRFYMLHTLSHLLISAISLECGYAASSISERIYSSFRGDEVPMAAIVLMTGSAGAEGTLGGLVEQGRRIVHHLGRALEMGQLCSNDPVCGHHSPGSDYAERFLEGAACHGCLYIAESSCERFNHHLDRALVVPTMGQSRELAFFS